MTMMTTAANPEMMTTVVNLETMTNARSKMGNTAAVDPVVRTTAGRVIIEVVATKEAATTAGVVTTGAEAVTTAEMVVIKEVVDDKPDARGLEVIQPPGAEMQPESDLQRCP
jgi:hypothetical protein